MDQEILKTARNNLTAKSTGSHKMPSIEVRLSDLVILGLFKKFQAYYLSKWTTPMAGIEEIAMNEWAKILGGITPEQMEYGLNNLPEEWPPTVFEFKELCIWEPEPIKVYAQRQNKFLIESDEVKENRKVAAASAVSEMRENMVRKNHG